MEAHVKNNEKPKDISNSKDWNKFYNELLFFMKSNNFTEYQIKCILHCLNSFWLTLPDNEWIDWEKFPVPEDIKGFFIKYEDGFIDCDRYDYKTKERKFRNSKVIGWKFMERTDEKSILC